MPRTRHSDETRTKRIEARIAPGALELVKRAAELRGNSVSDFVVEAAREKAERDLEENRVIRLVGRNSGASSRCCSRRRSRTPR